MYPGAGTWALDEEKLFEVLYFREDMPLMPNSWDVDFSGVPIPATVFDRTGEAERIIYARSEREFQGENIPMLCDKTSVLMRHSYHRCDATYRPHRSCYSRCTV